VGALQQKLRTGLHILLDRVPVIGGDSEAMAHMRTVADTTAGTIFNPLDQSERATAREQTEFSIARLVVAIRAGQLLFSTLMVASDLRRFRRPKLQVLLLPWRQASQRGWHEGWCARGTQMTLL
jgi:hypothetical protein